MIEYACEPLQPLASATVTVKLNVPAAVGAPGKPVDLRIFAKPNTLKNRRMGVALARAEDADEAGYRAKAAAARVRIRYQG